jgi:hypothetical protein
MKRTLSLRGETLTELAAPELAEIGGGAITQYCNTIHFCNIPTLPLLVCIRK